MIRLTHAGNHHAKFPYVYVNPSLVARMWRDGEPEHTVLRFADGSVLQVAEEPEEIDDYIYEEAPRCASS